jgi:hypothetical protein
VSVETHSTHTAPLGKVGKLAFPIAFLVIGLTVAALFVSILKINNGTFVYTLDDPYIHLALSDQIRHGNYGLYPGTHAAPSSSILFPFILATVAGTALHPYFPLILNLLALFLTAEILRRFLLHLKLGEDDFALAAQAGALFLMALCFNIIGVVFTGLEHSLHILTVAAIVYGLALFLDRDKMPAWLPAAIILCPLLRYEGLAISVGAVILLTLRGRWRTAMASLAAIVFFVVGFSVFLHKLGLPPLPSSILSKSAVAAGGVGGHHSSFLSSVVANIDFMVGHPTGMILLLTAVIAVCFCVKDLAIKPRRWTSNGLMGLLLFGMICGHTAAGRFGWLDRYEDYVVLGSAMICIYLAKPLLRMALAPQTKDRWLLAGGTAGLLIVFGARYYHMTAMTPHNSNNIYEQQLQMHHFVNDFWRGPVAVNDLGLVSYHNPYPVLDLGGLGSEKARLLMASDASADDYQTFVADSGVHLIIIYDEWFPGRVPDAWQKVGTMSLSRSHISAAHVDVQFYATDDATAAKVREELMEFKPTLPRRVRLQIY